jgi:hypothetical protein
MDLTTVRDDVAVLDILLRDIAKRPVDITDPDWLTKLTEDPPPAEEAGVAAEAGAALSALLDAYDSGDDRIRAEVRDIFRRNPSFRWGVGLGATWSSAADFRRRLLLISAHDQGEDPRDELVTLWGLCAEARKRGIDIEPIVHEVAALSGDADHYGMGTTRHLIERGLEKH